MNSPAIVLAEVQTSSQVIGMVVDSVSDVIALPPKQLRLVPEFSGSLGCQNLPAIGSVGERMLILLDVERLMSSAEMGLSPGQGIQ